MFTDTKGNPPANNVVCASLYMDPLSETTVPNVVNPDGSVLTTKFTNPNKESTIIEFQVLLGDEKIQCGDVDVLQPSKSDVSLETGTFT